MKKFVTRALALLTAISLGLSVCAAPSRKLSEGQQKTSSEEEHIVLPDDEFISYLNGVWEGEFHYFFAELRYYIDPVVLDFNIARSQPMLFKVTSIDSQCYQPPNGWTIQDGVLMFDFYADAWLAHAQLTIQPDGTLAGTYEQKGRVSKVVFTKRSSTPAPEGRLQTQFYYDGRSGDSWLAELRRFPNFSAKPGAAIPYTYELYNRNQALPLIYNYNVESVMDGRSDVEQMKALLNIVCDNFKHDGAVPLGSRMDPMSVIALSKQYDGVECRGLAVLLSEMLRDCGIPAKPIMCISSIEPAECHVLVHAYSASLGQWIMLDPSYRLILKNGSGQYMSLPMLRDALISGERIYANDEAGHNGTPFYMPQYRAYMSKNTFRFACATQFYYGGEKFADTDVKGRYSGGASANPRGKNVQNMLAPTGYKVPWLSSRSERVTTSAESFWAPPPVVTPPPEMLPPAATAPAPEAPGTDVSASDAVQEKLPADAEQDLRG